MIGHGENGLRATKIVPKDGSRPILRVSLLIDGHEVVVFPGEAIAPLRCMLQRIEAENPGLCGTDAATKDAPVERFSFDNNPGGDPTLN